MAQVMLPGNRWRGSDPPRTVGRSSALPTGPPPSATETDRLVRSRQSRPQVLHHQAWCRVGRLSGFETSGANVMFSSGRATGRRF